MDNSTTCKILPKDKEEKLASSRTMLEKNVITRCISGNVFQVTWFWGLLTQSIPTNHHRPIISRQEFWREATESCDRRGYTYWRENPSWMHLCLMSLKRFQSKSRHSYSIVRLQHALRKVANVVLTSLKTKSRKYYSCIESGQTWGFSRLFSFMKFKPQTLSLPGM